MPRGLRVVGVRTAQGSGVSSGDRLRRGGILKERVSLRKGKKGKEPTVNELVSAWSGSLAGRVKPVVALADADEETSEWVIGCWVMWAWGSLDIRTAAIVDRCQTATKGKRRAVRERRRSL